MVSKLAELDIPSDMETLSDITKEVEEIPDVVTVPESTEEVEGLSDCVTDLDSIKDMEDILDVITLVDSVEETEAIAEFPEEVVETSDVVKSADSTEEVITILVEEEGIPLEVTEIESDSLKVPDLVGRTLGGVGIPESGTGMVEQSSEVLQNSIVLQYS